MSRATIGVILLNWENSHLTVEALDSLLAASPRPDRVVVVDNGSRDASLERLEEWARSSGMSWALRERGARDSDGEWLTIIPARENRGFSAGNNHGIRFLRNATDVSHVLLLNNDARIAPDAIDSLRAALERRPDAGILTGTIYVDHGSEDRSEIWYSGGIELRFRGLVAHQTEPPADDAIRPVEFVSGCAMLISRSVFERIGLLSEWYQPLYGEDAEYSRRARLAGLPVLYAPRAVFYHKVGATVGPSRLSEAMTYTQIRHRLFYVRRNFRGGTKAVALLYTALTKPVRALIETLSGRPRIAAALLRGTVAGLLTDVSDERDPALVEPASATMEHRH